MTDAGAAPPRPIEPVAMVLSPSRTLRLLLAVAAAVSVAMIAGELSRNAAAPDDRIVVEALRTLRRYFSPSGEQTVVAWFTAALLLAGGLALFAIAAATRAEGGRSAARWRVLGAIFVFLSCDETVAFHERLGEWVKDAVSTGGPFLWAWVIPYAALLAIVAVAYVPFLRRLPADTRRGILAAAALYVGGALLLEMAQAAITDARGRGGGPVSVLAVVEETAEMTGAILFLHTLLAYLAVHLPVRVAVIDDHVASGVKRQASGRVPGDEADADRRAPDA